MSRILLLLAGLALTGCKSSTVNDGYAIDFTLIVDGTVMPVDLARIATLDIEVSGAESYSRSISVAGKLTGPAGLRYRPAARSGTLDFVFTASDGSNVPIASGSDRGVPLSFGATRLETVRLVAATPAPVDMSTSPPDLSAPADLTTPIGPDLSGVVYTPSTIAAMRQGGSGYFQLDSVVSIGRTPGTVNVTLYVQDAAGGSYSAIDARCSATSVAHPCTVASTVATIVDGHSVTVRGQYLKDVATHVETFFIDTIVDNGTATMPAPATMTLAQIERGAMNPSFWFQVVAVTVNAADTLTPFDFTPPEFTRSGATGCPYVQGFGVLPMSAPGTAGAACTNPTTQPAGQSTVNANEVLVSTQFYTGFTLSTDCLCAKTYSDTEPTATSTLSGAISGILEFWNPSGTGGYQYLAPKSLAAFNMTNTIPGM